jgi:hypothetical protein
MQGAAREKGGREGRKRQESERERERERRKWGGGMNLHFLVVAFEHGCQISGLALSQLCVCVCVCVCVHVYDMTRAQTHTHTQSDDTPTFFTRALLHLNPKPYACSLKPKP